MLDKLKNMDPVKLIWISRFLGLLAGATAVIGVTKGLGATVTQWASVATAILLGASRQIEQWLPKRADSSGPSAAEQLAAMPNPSPPPEKKRPGVDAEEKPDA